jgi:hypothetical protein
MKTFVCLLSGCIFIIACQRSSSDINNRTNNTEDSVIRAGDSLTYEVLTTDPVGWFGVWNQSDGVLTGNVFDSVTYGSPVYLPSGWRYSFKVPSFPFQALISVATHLWSDDITVNLYKNGQLIKSVKNDAMKGVAKLMQDIHTDTLTGTVAAPVLSYEVLVTEPDLSKFESDAWIGEWTTPQGVHNAFNIPVLQSEFAMPSGWKYSFRPEHLPFTMALQASPYSKDSGKITINFFVNGQLVKSSAARDWIYNMVYTVQ